jgi:hypothetical protein
MSEEFDDKLESCEGKGELTEVLKMAMSTSDCDQAEAALDACLRLTSRKTCFVHNSCDSNFDTHCSIPNNKPPQF